MHKKTFLFRKVFLWYYILKPKPKYAKFNKYIQITIYINHTVLIELISYLIFFIISVIVVGKAKIKDDLININHQIIEIIIWGNHSITLLLDTIKLHAIIPIIQAIISVWLLSVRCSKVYL
jgi:hypothetical protein